MSNNQEIKLAVARCLKLRIPFACFAYPGAKQFNFISCLPEDRYNPSNELAEGQIDSWDGFVIGLFDLETKARPIGIARQLSPVDILSLPDDFMPFDYSHECLSSSSTPYMHYYAQAHTIIKGLKGDDEKTVLSRIIAQQSLNNPLDVAWKYFECHPQCFRHIYYTFDTGLWFGATPELLLNVDSVESKYVSMSVAGTRLIGSVDEWDEKNVKEHDIVTAYISRVFEQFFPDTVEVILDEARFGNVEHLCHRVTGSGSVALSRIIPRLSPTPAVCGWPRTKSYKQIIDTETHQRLCYGGYIGEVSEKGASLYVNLRCAHVGSDFESKQFLYNLYGGGGLTIYSKEKDEWAETQAKMESLLNVINDIK